MPLARTLLVSTLSLFTLSLFTLTATAEPYSIDVHSQLTDGFEQERLEIHIDGKLAGVVQSTAAKPDAKITLKLHKPTHHYTISGEAIDAGGKRISFTGGGLIASVGYVDSLMENKKNGAEVVAGYQTLVRDISAAVPKADLTELQAQIGPKASAQSIADAEKRLKLKLPEDYKTFIQEVGRLSIGSENKSTVYLPEELMTVVDYYTREAELTDKQRQQIAKRYRNSTRDIVLDYFYLDEYSVLQAKPRCPKGQYGFMFPGYDMSLLPSATMVDDNPFMALIDYQDDIMGEPECANYTTVLGWGLIDFIAYNADHIFFMAIGNDDEGVEEVSLTIDSYQGTDTEFFVKFAQ